MILRKHQGEFNNIISGILPGSAVRTIYAHVTPGGGKSILPIIAGRLIPGRADRICWIAPRLTLIDQAEREFVNPHFRKNEYGIGEEWIAQIPNTCIIEPGFQDRGYDPIQEKMLERFLKEVRTLLRLITKK